MGYKGASGVKLCLCCLWIPKSHFALHLGRMLLRFGILLATFVQERKHRVAKAFAEPRYDTRNMEKGLMEEITLLQLHDLRSGPASKKRVLLAPHRADKRQEAHLREALHLPAGGEVLVSATATLEGRRIMSRDVVLFELEGDLVAGQVYFQPNPVWKSTVS